MINGKYCIAIMSVGSGVGESVISSINLSDLPLLSVGLGNNVFAYGAYDCDYVDFLPTIYSDKYINVLIKKCKKYNVDLIIPGSDDEALILSKNRKKLNKSGFKVLVSDYRLIKLLRDKEEMCNRLSKYSNVFVKSYSKNQVRKLINKNIIKFPLISKPRDGKASQGVEILLCIDDINNINNNHIVQELAVPHKDDIYRDEYLNKIQNKENYQVSEISIQIVRNKDGDIIGKMASYNKLKNGAPIEIVLYEKKQIWDDISKLLPVLKKLGHKGPLNIQGRVTDNGFKIFEINARFTGITGLRAYMGFNEVEKCINDWLGINKVKSDLIINYNRIGLRQMKDKAIPIDVNKEVKDIRNRINGKIRNAQTILVTGASGYLGRAIIDVLSSENYRVYAMSRNLDRIKGIYNDYKNVTCFSNSDIKSGVFDFGLVDNLIHCAFARPHKPDQEIINSLVFTNELFLSCTKYQTPNIINISSQSVYGESRIKISTEEDQVMPKSIYSQSKYSAELMANNIKVFSKKSNVTSLRLMTLSGGKSGLKPVDFLSKFVSRIKKNDKIEIIGGSQKIQRFDVRDAANAVISMIKTPSNEWNIIYNLGPRKTYSLREYVNIIENIAKNKYNIDARIRFIDQKTNLNIGVDSSKFYQDFSWEPSFDMEDTIGSLFQFFFKE